MGGTGMSYRVAKALGDMGEQVACDHLTAQGFELLDRNWRCERGELDIVARRGDLLVFCEVKTRRSQRYGDPAEAVTAAKLGRLRRLAAHWMGQHQVHAPSLRIDVIAVSVRAGRPPALTHLEGVA